MSKKLLSLLLAFAMVLGFSAGALAGTDTALTTAAPAGGDIVILHTNDVHGNYAKNVGYAGLAACKAEMAKTGYVTLVDAGDFSQGAAMAILSKGEYLVDIMNKVGYDVVVPGNTSSTTAWRRRSRTWARLTPRSSPATLWTSRPASRCLTPTR